MSDARRDDAEQTLYRESFLSGGKRQPTTNELDRMEAMVGEVLQNREDLFRNLLGGNGSWDTLGDECGYPDEITPQMYRDFYDRDAIGRRIVELMPKECWQGQPTVYEDEEGDEPTAFEDAWDALGRQLAVNGKSWYQDEKGSIVWDYLMRLDILSGIGQFGIMLLGIDDARNLQDPADGVEVLVNGRWVPDSTAGDKERQQWADDRQKDLLTENQHRDLLRSDQQQRVTANRYAADWREMVSRNRVATDGGNPGSGPFVQGTDGSYSSMDSSIGMAPVGGVGMPPTGGWFGQSPMGTDQQYFGVQFGPSQMFGKPAKGGRKLLFLRCFDESLVQVVRYEWNIRNPRFGLPVMYRVTLNDPRQPHSGVGLPLATVYVHWSRVIHVADNLVVSEIFGTPRMRPVFNNILNIRKILGASAEGYWRSCFTALSLETNPQLGGDVIVDKAGIRQMMADFYARLQRHLTLMGMSAKTLAPTVVDPTPFVAVQKGAICNQIGCPIRVFNGSERGELASSQDDEAWNERKQHRQAYYLTPREICPFVDRLIQVGVLPEPKKKVQQPPEPTLPTGRLTPQETAAPMSKPPKSGAPDKPDVGGAGKPPGGNGVPKPGQPPVAGNGKPPVGNQRIRRAVVGWEDTGRRVVVNYVPDRHWIGRDRQPTFLRGNKLLVMNSTPEKPDEPDKVVGVMTDGGYSVKWPDLEALSEKDKAGILLQRTQAYAAYVSGNLESVIPVLDFMTKFDGMEEEEASAIIGSAVDAQATQDDLHQQTAEDQGLKPTPPPGFEKEPPPPPPMAGMPGGPPATPIKVKPGEKLVHPGNVPQPVATKE